MQICIDRVDGKSEVKDVISWKIQDGCLVLVENSSSREVVYMPLHNIVQFVPNVCSSKQVIG